MTELVDDLLDGDHRALARTISLIEDRTPGYRDLVSQLHEHTGHADVIGITGSPGAGKSTLVDKMAEAYRDRGLTVGVIAIDPSSPFTGGAILGDRIRMQEHALDDGVFIRSMATRGHLGGLALATPQAVRVLDAAGFPWVLVETVGVGQVEVEIVGAADTTVVVVNPGWGDAVQANKAGLMEIADVFVINKADRPGAAETRRDLDAMLDLTAAVEGWRPPIVDVVATEGTGIAELWDTIGAHRAHLESTGELGRRRGQRAREELTRIVAERLLMKARRSSEGDRFDALLDRVEARSIDPWTAADELLDR